MTERSEVYAAIDSERDYQEVRWGPDKTDTGHLHSPAEWLVYIDSYVREALEKQARVATRTANEFSMHSLRKIAALAVVAMEQHGAPKRVV